MKKTYLTVIMALMLLLSQTAEAATVNVNLNTTRQTMRGYGGMNFPRWIGDLTAAQADKAFGNGSGQIGFTILRIDVPPNSSDWSAELPTAQRAINHGAIVLATPWSPPASMKTNNNLVGGQLRTDSYGAYANHLRDFANYMSSNGASLYAVSVQNEPDYLPDYESCGWSTTQMTNFLNNNASVIPTRVLAPETVHFKSDYVNAVASSSQCDIVGVHAYGGSITYYSGKEYWMTEHLVNNTNWSGALATGKEIHDCITANMSAYIWWYVRRSYGPIDESGNITKRGYVMSHYAKFVRPGYTRVDATASPQSGVYVTAYKSGNTLVIVAINQNSSSQSVTFSPSGGSVSSYTKYETTSASGNNVSNKGSVGSTNTLAASSINTFVGTIGGGTAPGQASNPSPANGATSVSTTADLSWTAGSGATSHDVYFGTTSPGTFRGEQTGTTYDCGTMSNSTTYYWRIDENNDYGTTTGTVWSFTTAAAGTPPGQASNPTPSNGATNVGVTTDLSWTAGSGATSHDVYFGTSSPGTFRGNQTGTTYDTGTMSNGTTYYWRINEKNTYGTTTGNVWSFTTIGGGGSSVSLLGTWVTGTSHTKESGSNRALIFIAHAESTSTINLSAVSYGGQAMTKVVDYSYNAASGYAYAAAFILKETGVAAASSSTFTVTWSGTAPGNAGYSSVFLANVNQTTATGATGTGGRTSNPVTTSSSLATSSGDIVILGATCGNAGSYTLNNSFIEGNDQQIGGTVTGVTGRKSATGANETPSATYSSTINRQMIIGLVVKHQ